MKRSITLFCALLLLIVSAVPAFAEKFYAEIEYFYSDDGTLTGKAFNGNRVNFEYDLRGQLLAVKDASGKDYDHYVGLQNSSVAKLIKLEDLMFML